MEQSGATAVDITPRSQQQADDIHALSLSLPAENNFEFIEKLNLRLSDVETRQSYFTGGAA